LGNARRRDYRAIITRTEQSVSAFWQSCTQTLDELKFAERFGPSHESRQPNGKADAGSNLVRAGPSPPRTTPRR
jgi:hypothetical protein